MAGPNRQNRNNQQTIRQAPAVAATATTETASVAAAATPENVTEDKVVLSNQPAPPAPPAPPKPPVLDPELDPAKGGTDEESSTDEPPVVEEVEDEDHRLVVELKGYLADFKKANEIYGKEPKDFLTSANIAKGVVRFVVRHPKVVVLNTVYTFFHDNADGVCTAENFLKGVSELSNVDGQKIGLFFNIFNDLSKKIPTAVDTHLINITFGKPEIGVWFTRRRAANAQGA